MLVDELINGGKKRRCWRLALTFQEHELADSILLVRCQQIDEINDVFGSQVSIHSQYAHQDQANKGISTSREHR